MLMVDWIHEYTKERVRRRNLASRPGVLNRIKLGVDASQAWIILTFTGIVSQHPLVPFNSSHI